MDGIVLTFDWARGSMDMVAARNAGIDFLTHKATEGTRTLHVKYRDALTRARDAGIPVLGAYIVPRTPGNGGHGSVAAQVDYFLNYVNQQTPWWKTYPYWMWQVDTEDWGYDKVSPTIGAEVVRLLKEKTGRFVIHYAPRWAYGSTVPNNAPLWSSAYGSNPATGYKAAYAAAGGDSGQGWNVYSGQVPFFWQYGSNTIIGSQHTCDANAFRGTVDELKNKVKGGMPVVKPTPITQWPNVVLTPTGQKLVEIMSYYPKPSEIYITSGADGDHGTNSYHYGGTYNASPVSAIDIGFGGVGEPEQGRDVAKWLYDLFWDKTVELIHSTPFSTDQGFYVKNQIRYPGGGPYDATTRAAHLNHVHFATSSALADQILASLKANVEEDDVSWDEHFIGTNPETGQPYDFTAKEFLVGTNAAAWKAVQYLEQLMARPAVDVNALAAALAPLLKDDVTVEELTEALKNVLKKGTG